MGAPPLLSCGHPEGDDFAWPGIKGGDICQQCFEAEADREWWEFMTTIDFGGES